MFCLNQKNMIRSESVWYQQSIWQTMSKEVCLKSQSIFQNFLPVCIIKKKIIF